MLANAAPFTVFVLFGRRWRGGVGDFCVGQTEKSERTLALVERERLGVAEHEAVFPE